MPYIHAWGPGTKIYYCCASLFRGWKILREIESWHILHLNVKQLWHHIVIARRPWLACKPAGHWHSFKRGSQLHRASHLHLHNFFATKHSNLSLFFSVIFSQLPKKLELPIIAQRKTVNSKIGQSKCCSTEVDFVNLEIPGDDQNTKSAQPPIWQTWLRSNMSSTNCIFELPGDWFCKSGYPKLWILLSSPFGRRVKSKISVPRIASVSHPGVWGGPRQEGLSDVADDDRCRPRVVVWCGALAPTQKSNQAQRGDQ